MPLRHETLCDAFPYCFGKGNAFLKRKQIFLWFLTVIVKIDERGRMTGEPNCQQGVMLL